MEHIEWVAFKCPLVDRQTGRQKMAWLKRKRERQLARAAAAASGESGPPPLTLTAVYTIMGEQSRRNKEDQELRERKRDVELKKRARLLAAQTQNLRPEAQRVSSRGLSFYAPADIVDPESPIVVPKDDTMLMINEACRRTCDSDTSDVSFV